MRKMKIDEEKKIISIDINFEKMGDEDIFDQLMILTWARCVDVEMFVYRAVRDKIVNYNDDLERRGYE